LIFKEPGSKFNISTLSSRFTQVYLVIEPIIREDDQVFEYKITAANKTSIPPYAPYIPDPPIIPKDEFREFVLTKAINAARSSFKGEKLRTNMETVRATTLEDIFRPNLKNPKSAIKIKHNNKKTKSKSFLSTKTESSSDLLKMSLHYHSEDSNVYNIGIKKKRSSFFKVFVIYLSSNIYRGRH